MSVTDDWLEEIATYASFLFGCVLENKIPGITFFF